MKSLYPIIFGLVTSVSVAAEPQTVNVPLTNPGQPYELEIDPVRGEIHLIAEDREDLLFEISSEGTSRRIMTPNGPREIPGASLELEIEERNNHVSVDSGWPQNSVNITARIPRRVKLELETVHEGVIVVDGGEGSIEASNVHGPIRVIDFSGPVIAESIHGDISATIVRMPEPRDMSFKSMHGNIEVSLPADYASDLHIISAGDEIYSDFEIEIVPVEPKVVRRENGGRFVVEMDQRIVAAINGGGPATLLETRYGDVRVLKSSR